MINKVYDSIGHLFKAVLAKDIRFDADVEFGSINQIIDCCMMGKSGWGGKSWAIAGYLQDEAVLNTIYEALIILRDKAEEKYQVIIKTMLERIDEHLPNIEKYISDLVANDKLEW